MQAEGILEWDSLTLKDSGGKAHTYARGEEIDLRFWRASHLREHMTKAEPVTVEYRKEDKGLVAISISE